MNSDSCFLPVICMTSDPRTANPAPAINTDLAVELTGSFAQLRSIEPLISAAA